MKRASDVQNFTPGIYNEFIHKEVYAKSDQTSNSNILSNAIFHKTAY